ncbi:hypothetical protein [Nocardioides sp. MH1]|uniref:hypothetical protein n=1 Tax=Nocardioides sp. MH1 TaxID=3242490 RepID=UPI003522FF76
MSTSFTHPDRDEQDARSLVTDGPVQDSQQVEEERGVPDRDEVVGADEPDEAEQD